MGLVCLNYIGNFSHYANFGFYEDDYLLAVPIFSWSQTDLWQHVANSITTWPQGRPLWWLANDILTFVISRFDSIALLYASAFISSCLCLLALYRFARMFLSTGATFMATALFSLYPVANAKAIFMHQIYFYWVPILVLVLFTQFLKGRYAAFYIGSVIVLLTYEPYFLLLPFVPLLAQAKSWRRRFRDLLATSAILAVVLGAILIVRHQLGDPRTNALLDNPAELASRVVTAPWIGFLTTVKASIVFPLDALRYGNAALFIEGLIALSIACGILMASSLVSESENQRPGVSSGIGSVMIAGAALFLTPYLYRFIPDYYPPVVDIGRLSILHYPSAIGATLFIGAALDVLLRLLPKMRRVTLICCAVYLALLVVFANYIQRSEYVRYWRMQQKFLQDVIAQTRDLEDGEVAIVDIESGVDEGFDARPTTPGFPPFWIATYTSNLLELLNQYPTDWQRPPKLFGFWEGVPATVQDGGLWLATPPWQAAEQQARVRDGKFAWLEWVEGHLIRRTQPVIISGVALTPKPLDTSAPIPPPTKLALTFFNANDLPWPSMQNAKNYPH